MSTTDLFKLYTCTNKLKNIYDNLMLSETWYMLSLFIGVYGIFAQFLPKILPDILLAIFRYGKSAEGVKYNSVSNVMLVPKSWFTHFYIFACTFHSFILWSLFWVYFQSQNCPLLLASCIKIASPTAHPVNSNVLPEDVVVATLLMVIQVFRRFYECVYVNINSNAKMSILHYSYGILFYFAVGLSLIVEAPGFGNKSSPEEVIFTGAWLTTNHVLGTALFLFGWCVQFDSHLILSNLRRTSKDKQDALYAIPYGGLFKYLSCPHYFGEVAMYFAILIVFGGQNRTWLAVFINVLTNQILAGLMSHSWYKNTFKGYPNDRKAVIPFIL